MLPSLGAALVRKDNGNCHSVSKSPRLQSSSETATSANGKVFKPRLVRNMRDIHNFLDQKYPNDAVIPSAVINVLIDTEDVFIRYKNEYIERGKPRAAIVRQIYCARVNHLARIVKKSGNLTSEMSTANIYGDQIEWMSENFKNRETIMVYPSKI